MLRNKSPGKKPQKILPGKNHAGNPPDNILPRRMPPEKIHGENIYPKKNLPQ